MIPESGNNVGANCAAVYYMKHVSKPVKESEFREISSGFNAFLIDKIVNGETVRLPERLGTVRIAGKKIKPRINPETGYVEGVAPDWKQTKELWKRCESCRESKQLVFYLNEHTNGIRYCFKWSKTGVFIPNRDFYSLKMSRVAKSKFKSALNSGKEYIVEQFKN